MIAAKYLPSWEIIDYASANKIDVPSGTTRELAEALAAVAQNQLAVPIEQTQGPKEARGTAIDGTQVHSKGTLQEFYPLNSERPRLER